MRKVLELNLSSLPALEREFLVVCLCAEWCDTCRDYRTGFDALGKEFHDVDFLWVDIEENASLVDDFEVENFPTILIQRGEQVLFYGTMPPHHQLLRRTLEAIREQTAAQSCAYAIGNDERRGWQERCNFRATLKSHS